MKNIILFFIIINSISGFSQKENPFYEKIVLDYLINSLEFKQEDNYQIIIKKDINSILTEKFPFFYPSKFEGINSTSNFKDSNFNVSNLDLDKYKFKNFKAKNRNKIKLIVYKRYLVDNQFVVVTIVKKSKTVGKVYFFKLNFTGEILDSYSDSFLI